MIDVAVFESRLALERGRGGSLAGMIFRGAVMIGEAVQPR
jgi:hypothetical protein